jgi:hypothetical protein
MAILLVPKRLASLMRAASGAIRLAEPAMAAMPGRAPLVAPTAGLSG